MELTQSELSLLMVALDWYQLGVERGEVDKDGQRDVSNRCRNLDIKLYAEYREKYGIWLTK
jgi:hypothetical protein